MTEALLHRCSACRRYTLGPVCPECGGPTRTPHPARFSPQDRWGKYRRALLSAESATYPDAR
ncbi:MAG: RNA-protein complex protein Nop10 [Thermoplasmata archaeon]|nr:RNA-protein complex protein Nop10 [Thermoplasmata archaeon]MCI4344334.1 RNA-protein complex protein Nop10 [Thermoplasmata archaeon]